MAKFYLIRHGSTKLNEENDKIRGWMDWPEAQLSELGKKEIRNNISKIPKLDWLIASDLWRTKETANIISKATWIPIIKFTQWLRPRHLWEMQGVSAPSILDKMHKYVDNPTEKVPQWESFNNFVHRALTTIDEIVKKYPKGNIWIITHHRIERLMKALEKTWFKGIDDNIFKSKWEKPWEWEYIEVPEDHKLQEILKKYPEDNSGLKKKVLNTKSNDKMKKWLPKLWSGARFKKLSWGVEKEYEKKGKSPEEAKRIWAAVAAKIGMEKYGKKKMLWLAKKGKK